MFQLPTPQSNKHLIEHLEEEELRIKLQISIRLTSLICLCSTRQALTPIFNVYCQVQRFSSHEAPRTTESAEIRSLSKDFMLFQT